MLGKSAKITDPSEPVIVKKYANRRLYNTETSTYVTLEDLAVLVRAERDFVVFDAKSGEDLTHSVLTQIIVEQESRPGGNPMLPIPFLRQLIRFYGKSIEHMVPSYLQVSLDALAREQDRFKQQFSTAFTGSPFDAYQEQARKNVELFENAMAVFSPFGKQGSADSTGGAQAGAQSGAQEGAQAPQPGSAQPGSATASSSAAAAADKAADKARGPASPTQPGSAQPGAAQGQTHGGTAQGNPSGSPTDEMAAMKQQLEQMQKMFDKLQKDQKK